MKLDDFLDTLSYDVKSIKIVYGKRNEPQREEILSNPRDVYVHDRQIFSEEMLNSEIYLIELEENVLTIYFHID